MRFPHRSVSSIQPLPSIYTAFPPNCDSNQSTGTSGIDSGTCLIREIEDGIEVVPIERSHHLSAPILSPDQAEKELFVVSEEKTNSCEKPLPTLPGCLWYRMSQGQRILALLVLQFLMLSTIGLSLMAVKGRYLPRQVSTESSYDDPPRASTSAIQRGIFALPIGLPQQQSSVCLARMNESVAWQCTAEATLQLSILPGLMGDNNGTMITIGLLPGNDSNSHGERMPSLPPIELVALDNAGSDASPTYYFRTTYNKVVLLTDEDFGFAQKERLLRRDTTSSSGDSLWQCSFNETQLEGYIYASKSSQINHITTTPKPANATATSQIPTIPYSVKLVEERIPNGRTPYCEKMVVGRDATQSSQGERFTLTLSNPAADVAASASKLMARMKDQKRQQQEDSDHCRCQWLTR